MSEPASFESLPWIFALLLFAGGAAIGWIFTRLASHAQQSESQYELGEHQSWVMKVLDDAQEGMIVTDPSGTILNVNQFRLASSGYRADELIGRNSQILRSDRHTPEFYADIHAHIAEHGSWRGELWTRKKDGELVPELLTASSINDDNGKLLGYAAIFSDLSDVYEQKREQEKRSLLFSQATEMNGIGVWELDMLTGTPHWDEQTYKIHEVPDGWEPELNEAINFYVPEDRPLVEEMIQNEIEHGGGWDREFRFITYTGRRIWVRTLGRAIKENGQLLKLVGTFQNITEQKEHREQLEYLANYDPLTDLPSRLLFADRFRQMVAASKRSKHKVLVGFLDLDEFKAVNDQYGHTLGDELLKQVAIRLSASIREQDTLSRQGGDEFTFIIQGIEQDSDADVCLKRILESLQQPFRISTHSFTMSASIGAVLYPDYAKDMDTLIRYADQAMYQAKISGKNRYRVFDQSLEQMPTKSD
ncbi:diguanylate cyclase domain-containing protein [Paraferrimonas sedimenticola]|uniref:PAS domain S-box-containing protein/diguanylate cyclase (GGDEF) domain-containing protein n=1 Tax=Paraferrimonas sedimenticola TaxID=375674 RepID=A0AA37RUR0_9GAMM|nr:diguanylate cyclase [Paraferrimonas sedimenticola]GLP95498.1 hypothetical protein GCM10007895_08040 [Paraferrimonas sedimenticola]